MIYHPKIEFRGRSNYDERLVVATFEPDSGEVDSYLNMEPVYIDSYDGSTRTDYGAKYKDVANSVCEDVEKRLATYAVQLDRSCCVLSQARFVVYDKNAVIKHPSRRFVERI